MRASSIAAAQAAASAAVAAVRANSGAESARDAPRSARELLSHRLGVKKSASMGPRISNGPSSEGDRRRCAPIVSWHEGPAFSREGSRQGLYLPLPCRSAEGSDGEGQENGVYPSQSDATSWDLPTSYDSCRMKVKVMLENPASGKMAAFVQYTMFIVIMAAVTCAICETIPEMEHEYIFHLLEPFFTTVFTFEITARWWVAASNWDFFGSPFSIIDILATLPGYVDIVLRLILDADNEMAQAEKHKRIISMNSLRAIRLADLMRIVRLLRVLRVANTMRQWEMINVVLKSIYGSLQGILVLISFTTVGTILSSTVAYVFEMGDDTKFTSIPASMWWAASTITAVGYGDLVPTTVAGKLTAVTTMFLGTIIMAVCIAVITNSFTIQYQRELYLARMRRLQQRAEEHGHTNLAPLTPQRARLYSKEPGSSLGSRRRLPRPMPVAGEVARPEVVRALPSDRFSGPGRFVDEEDDLDDDGDEGVENDDIATFVKELEEMTEALLLTFEAYLDQGEAKDTPHTSPSRQSGLGRAALDMLRKNSHVWFDQARNFSHELATWATDERALPSSNSPPPGSNRGRAAP